jgi:hypothetical protein
MSNIYAHILQLTEEHPHASLEDVRSISSSRRQPLIAISSPRKDHGAYYHGVCIQLEMVVFHIFRSIAEAYVNL